MKRGNIGLTTPNDPKSEKLSFPDGLAMAIAGAVVLVLPSALAILAVAGAMMWLLT